jgi:hypothetical protein
VGVAISRSPVWRRAAAWIVALSLIDGLMLPFVSSAAVADPDGACGPVFVLAHSIEHFEAPLPAPTGHCAVCHMWNAMASASTSARADFAPPTNDAPDPALMRPDRLSLFEQSQASPRGPPSRA